MKAIETNYAGYKFRSRLEARYAVLFDQIGAKWAYEIEGFELPEYWYLPDFFIEFNDTIRHDDGTPPTAGMYVEIKPSQPSDAEAYKCRELSKVTGHVCYLVYGQMGQFGSAKFKDGAHVRSTDPDDDFIHYLVFHCSRPKLAPFTDGYIYNLTKAIDFAKSYRFDRRPTQGRKAA